MVGRSRVSREAVVGRRIAEVRRPELRRALVLDDDVGLRAGVGSTRDDDFERRHLPARAARGRHRGGGSRNHTREGVIRDVRAEIVGEGAGLEIEKGKSGRTCRLHGGRSRQEKYARDGEDQLAKHGVTSFLELLGASTTGPSGSVLTWIDLGSVAAV